MYEPKYTKEERASIIKEFERSTESQRDFCRRVNVNRSTLRGWLRAKAKREETKKQVEKVSKEEKLDFGVIQINTTEEVKKDIREPGVITFCCDTFKIELKKGYDKTLLKEVVKYR